MEIGAQLYTLKTYCQNEKDLARSLEKVAGMGYSCVQLSAIGPIAPERIKTICDDNGLKIVLTHTPEAEVHGRPEETIEKHRLFGCKYIGIGSLPERYRNPDFLPYFAEDFLPAAEKFRAAGMKLMYHNHCFEYERLPGGDTMMDRLLAMMPADLMGLTADTYWLQYGGVDVNKWLKERGRGCEPVAEGACGAAALCPPEGLRGQGIYGPHGSGRLREPGLPGDPGNPTEQRNYRVCPGGAG